MAQSALWISFYHRQGKSDQWALCLDTRVESECHIWQATGDAFEFVANHSQGTRCDTLPNFKEKWLIKANLTEEEGVAIRSHVDDHPVDNEGEYWDCRVYCFELLGILEEEKVLKKDDEHYNKVRRKLHGKWKAEDGISLKDSEAEQDSEDEPSQPVTLDAVDSGGTKPGPHETGTGNPTPPTPPTPQAETLAGNRKRALSHGSGTTSRPREQTSKDQGAHDPRQMKRQKDE